MVGVQKLLRSRWKQSPDHLAFSELDAGPEFLWPPDFKIDHYPGLLACELRRVDQGTSRIAALWKTTGFREASNTALAKKLNATVQSTGLLLSVKQKAGRIPASLGEWLLKGGALIGALTVMSSLFSSWLGIPSISLTVEGVQPTNGSVGNPVTFRTLVLNNSRTVAADVELAVSSPTAGSISTDIRRATVPGGGQTAVTVDATFTQPGDHAVSISATGRAGLLIPSDEQRLVAPVRVWPLISRTPIIVQAERTTARVAFLRMNVAAGSATVKGITCLVTAPRVEPGIRFIGATPSVDGGGRRQSSDGGQRRTITLQWRTAISRPFEWQPIAISLDSVTNQTPESWQDLASSIQPDCEAE